MSAWLEGIKRNAVQKDQEVAPEEKERINNLIDRLVREVRTKDTISRKMDRLLSKKYIFR